MTLPTRYQDVFLDRLTETGGNVSQACSALGLQRMTVYRWAQQDRDFREAWDLALDASRQDLKERVVETAQAMGIGDWAPVLDPITDAPMLDDDFEPLMRFETRHVDARILMKLMDKTMRDEVRRVDARSIVAGRVEHSHRDEPAYNLVLVDADGSEAPLLGAPSEAPFVMADAVAEAEMEGDDDDGS